jgi:DNA-cytosine methyltransferase
MKLKALDLFSGIGGFSLGLDRAGIETVAFCEMDPTCQEVLMHHWPDVPVFNDVRNLRPWQELPSGIDLIVGGYPCTGHSVAGKKKGFENEGSALWKEYLRIAAEIKPRYCIIENSHNLRSTGLAELLRAFHEIGYNAEWSIISGYSIGAPHQRERIYIVFWRADIPYPNPFRCWETDPQKAETSQGWWAKRRFKRDSVYRKASQVESRVLQLADGFPERSSESEKAEHPELDRARVIIELTKLGLLRVDHETGLIYSSRIRGMNGQEVQLTGSVINGYIAHRLYYKGKKWQTKAHQIVWVSKHGRVPDGLEIDHINRKKYDNRLANLRTVTKSENAKNRDLSHVGLSSDQKKQIALSYLESDMTMKEVASIYGISKSRVDQVVQEYKDKAEEYKVAMLGNALLPQIPELIGRALVEHEESLGE